MNDSFKVGFNHLHIMMDLYQEEKKMQHEAPSEF